MVDFGVGFRLLIDTNLKKKTRLLLTEMTQKLVLSNMRKMICVRVCVVCEVSSNSLFLVVSNAIGSFKTKLCQADLFD